jgi:hypothetical protein
MLELGGAEPDFRILFSVVFHVVSLGISFRLATCGVGGSKSVIFCVIYLQIFQVFCSRFSFPLDCEKCQYNAVLCQDIIYLRDRGWWAKQSC